MQGGGEIIDAPGFLDTDPFNQKGLMDVLAEVQTLFVVVNEKALRSSSNVVDSFVGKKVSIYLSSIALSTYPVFKP